MNLVLSGRATIKDINQKFQEQFPFLKLEFHPNGFTGCPATVRRVLPGEVLLRNITKTFSNSIEINEEESAEELQQDFKRSFGLNVQVLRRDEYVWIKPSQTKELTLEKQNDIGQHASRPYRYNTNTLFL